jgi:hypothetical protein
MNASSMWAERRAVQTDKATAVSSPKSAYFKNKFSASGVDRVEQSMSPFRKSN